MKVFYQGMEVLAILLLIGVLLFMVGIGIFFALSALKDIIKQRKDNRKKKHRVFLIAIYYEGRTPNLTMLRYTKTEREARIKADFLLYNTLGYQAIIYEWDKKEKRKIRIVDKLGYEPSRKEDFAIESQNQQFLLTLELNEEIQKLKRENSELNERNENLVKSRDYWKRRFKELKKEHKALKGEHEALKQQHEELKKEADAHWRQLSLIAKTHPEVFPEYHEEDGEVNPYVYRG